MGTMGQSAEAAVEIVLIHNDPPCKKCLDTKAVIEGALAEAEVDAEMRELHTGTPEAAAFGVVIPPMVLVNGKVVSAGFVPVRSGLVKLIRKEAGSA
jgi:hypothetical protein